MYKVLKSYDRGCIPIGMGCTKCTNNAKNIRPFSPLQGRYIGRNKSAAFLPVPNRTVG